MSGIHGAIVTWTPSTGAPLAFVMTYRNAFAPRPGARPACACTAIVSVPELLCTVCTGVSENVRSPPPPSALPPQRGTPISSSESAASEANDRVQRLISGCKLTDSGVGRHAKNDRTPRDSSGGCLQGNGCDFSSDCGAPPR